jgi:hypothetical protein
VLAACLAMLLLAVSTRPTLGGMTLAHVPLPQALERALGAIRAGGRFVWPLTYLVMAWAISSSGSLRAGTLLVAAAFVFQCADLAGKAHELRTRFRQPDPALGIAENAGAWRALLSRCPVVEMVSEKHPGEGWIAPAIVAAQSRALFTPAPTVRYSQQLEAQRLAHAEGLVRGATWQPGVIYLLAPPLPLGSSVRDIAAKLPPGMRHSKLGPSDIVYDAHCAAP